MRKFIGFIALALLTALVLYLLAPKVNAQTTEGPGSCLVVNDLEDHYLQVQINYPNGYAGIVWNIHPGPQVLTLADQNGSDRIVVTPNGKWDINVKGYTNDLSGARWHYDANRNTTMGCNGSWVVDIP
jgi:hypothetical protein